MTHVSALEPFGQRIARLRAMRGWTQAELAERLAVSRVAVSHFELGLAVPSERTVVLLAGLFRQEPHELVADSNYPPAKAERLPGTACRYTETELQLALLQRDIEWLSYDRSHMNRVLSQWRLQIDNLLQNAYDLSERAQLNDALAALNRFAAAPDTQG